MDKEELKAFLRENLKLWVEEDGNGYGERRKITVGLYLCGEKIDEDYFTL